MYFRFKYYNDYYNSVLTMLIINEMIYIWSHFKHIKISWIIGIIYEPSDVFIGSAPFGVQKGVNLFFGIAQFVTFVYVFDSLFEEVDITHRWSSSSRCSPHTNRFHNRRFRPQLLRWVWLNSFHLEVLNNLLGNFLKNANCQCLWVTYKIPKWYKLHTISCLRFLCFIAH